VVVVVVIAAWDSSFFYSIKKINKTKNTPGKESISKSIIL